LLASGETFDPIDLGYVNANTTGTFTYWVDCNCDGCGQSERTPVMLTIYPNPDPVSILGDLSVCPGSEEDYTVDPANALSTYEWSISPAEAGTVTASTGAQVSIEWGSTIENATIFVTETDANGCVMTSSVDVIIEIDQTVACKQLTNVSLDDNCMAVIPAGVFVQVAAYDLSSYQVISVVNDETGEELMAAPDGSITLTDKGTFTVTVEHTCSGNTCWSTLTAVDTQKPTIVCPVTKAVKCDGDLKPVWPDDYPTALDNCCIEDDVEETYHYSDTSYVAAGTELRGFTGWFDPMNWNEFITGGEGTITWSEDGETLTIVSDGADITGAQAQTSVWIDIPENGTLSFEYDFATDNGAGEAGAPFIVDGAGNLIDITPFTGGNNTVTISNFGVTPEDDLYFAGISVAGLTGGTLTISDFTFTLAEDMTLDAADECGGGLLRTWTVTDCCGNVSEACTQLVIRVRPDLEDLTFPDDITLQCVDGFPGVTPEDLSEAFGDSDTDGDVDIYNEDYPALQRIM